MEKERIRLDEVKRYLNNFPEVTDKLQDIVTLASQITGVPVAFITLIDEEIQWIPVKRGYEVDQMPRATSFCTHAIEQEDVLVIADPLKDERFANNPLVTHPPAVRYYAGVSLKSAQGSNVGTLCVMDVESHDLNSTQLESLKALSRQVTNVIELNSSLSYLKKTVAEIEEQNDAFRKIAQVQSHDIREPLTAVMGVINLIKEEGYNSNKQYLECLETAAHRLDEKIKTIVAISANAHSLH
jgi:GAF domain-containing protein